MPAAAAAAAVVGGALISSSADKSAAKTQADATRESIDEQRRQYDLTRSDYAPYREAGYKALGQYQTEIDKPITAADVMADPGYQFGLTQGQQALDRKTAAMGGRVSGAALKAAARYGTDYASTGYNAAYQRGQDRLNRLASLANIGQTATGSSAAAGTSAANAISNLISSQGNASAAGQSAQGNIWGNAANQLGAIASNYLRPSTPDYSAYGYQNGSDMNTTIFSDRRLKTNIVQIGKTAKGNTWYRWDWKTGGSGEGVIAQEVAHIPGAVVQDHDGLLMVDYSKV